jgi:hypothetical protein
MRHSALRQAAISGGRNTGLDAGKQIPAVTDAVRQFAWRHFHL